VTGSAVPPLVYSVPRPVPPQYLLSALVDPVGQSGYVTAPAHQAAVPTLRFNVTTARGRSFQVIHSPEATVGEVRRFVQGG
jgi:hypothetical protein